MKIVCLIMICLSAHFALAQDSGSDFRFQPPRPPPLDPATDFDDMDEDMMEMGDEGARPPPPPPIPSTNPGGPSDFNPSTSNTYSPNNRGGGHGSRLGNGKVRFEIVEGEFLEKGKKRGRGDKLRANGSASQ